MAMPAWVAEKWSKLNAEDQKQAETFIDFLLMRQKTEGKASTATKSSIRLGIWKDEPCFIAEDFDESPSDFKEYT